MNPSRRHQRGEGKIGCIVTFMILASAIAIAFKMVPVYWSDNELKDAANDLASRASSLKNDAITLQMRTKARDLEIAEAMQPGAITVNKSGDGQQGTCTITLHYSRKVDLYGIYEWPVNVDTKIAVPYLSGL